MFVWRVQRLLELFAQFQPAITAGIDRLSPAWATPGWSDKLAEEFPRMPSISVDYALVEPQAQAGRAAGGLFVVPASFQWDDVGSWQSLPAVLGRDEAGNTVTGPHCGLDTQGCVVRTTADHLVATIGLRDCVVVHTPDATLVAPRDDEDALRKLVARLNELGLGGWL
jgi:mannose-1-phosphate guanylyltransferase